jgi:hypothetical protein
LIDGAPSLGSLGAVLEHNGLLTRPWFLSIAGRELSLAFGLLSIPGEYGGAFATCIGVFDDLGRKSLKLKRLCATLPKARDLSLSGQNGFFSFRTKASLLYIELPGRRFVYALLSPRLPLPG